MEEWKEYRLGDVAIIKGGKRLPKGINLISTPNNHPYIRVRDLGFNKTLELISSYEYVDDETQKLISKYIVNTGDIIISIVGTIGLIGIVGKTLNNANLTENCVKVIDILSIEKEYLYYFLISASGQAEIKKGIVGAVQLKLPIKNIQDIIIKAPNLLLQRKISNILSSLDDKIELNRRINENLEQQAQALFKSWFVDNSNPNWNEITLSEIASFIGGYSYKGKELADSSNIAMATIKNFGRNGGFKADGFKDINPSAKLKEYHNVDLFDILVAHTDVTQNADIIGNAELLLTCGKYDSVIFSMDLVKVTPKKNFPYRFLLAAMLKNKYFKKHCLGYVNGTTVLHLDKKALPEFETKIPSASEAKWMNCVLASYYKRIAEILQENDRLINLRDTLLPKLMSGKLRFSEIETEDSSALKD